MACTRRQTATLKAEHTAYERRLRSYNLYYWPINLKGIRQRLANAGFVYLGYRDVVECETCHGRMKDWEATDDPFIQHLRFFPNCRFAREKVDSYIIRQAFEALTRSAYPATDISRTAVGENDNATWPDLANNTHAKHCETW